MISCDIHDYIEIACTYHYQIELVLADGEVIQGTARDKGLLTLIASSLLEAIFLFSKAERTWRIEYT